MTMTLVRNYRFDPFQIAFYSKLGYYAPYYHLNRRDRMKKITSVLLMTVTLGLGHAAMADSVALRAVSQIDNAGANQHGKRILWEPHLRIFNDTTRILVVYTSSTKMTYYPSDVKDPYYGLKTWGAQNVIILDKETSDVFYDGRVVDETFLHITVKMVEGKPVFSVVTEPMHETVPA